MSNEISEMPVVSGSCEVEKPEVPETMENAEDQLAKNKTHDVVAEDVIENEMTKEISKNSIIREAGDETDCSEIKEKKIEEISESDGASTLAEVSEAVSEITINENKKSEESATVEKVIEEESQ